MIGLELEKYYAVEAKERQGTRTDLLKQNNFPLNLAESLRDNESRTKAAKAIDVSHFSISKAKKIQRVAPDLAEEVARGERSLNDAYREARQREQAMPTQEPLPKQSQSQDVIKLVGYLKGGNNHMTLKEFMNHCSPDARAFLEYVYKKKGAYHADQVVAEIVHYIGADAAMSIFTVPGAFRRFMEDRACQ